MVGYNIYLIIRSLSDMSRFFLLLLTAFITFSSYSFAAANNYLVENVNVNVLGKSPSNARNKAVATARRDAFLILLTRLDLDPNILDSIEDEEVSDMVRSEQIDHEKMAGNNYSATFNIMFSQDFVDHILSNKNIEQTATHKITQETSLLIPVKMVDNRIILWENSNDWKKSITQTIQQKFANAENKKFLVPEADIENLTTLNRDNVQAIDHQKLEPLLNRYHADVAYVILFSYDDIRNKVTIDVSNIQKYQKKKVRLSFVNINHLEPDHLLDKVAFKTLDYLASNSSFIKDKNKDPNLIKMHIPIDSLNEWLVIKKRLEASGLVEKLLLESVSRDYALISVTYKHPKQTIIESFKSAGLDLDKKDRDVYILTPN